MHLRKSFNTPVIINDFLDIVQVVDADGLHTGQDDIDVITQRQLLGEHKIIGRTTHSLKQGLAAQEQGADYVSVGPIWSTPSKPDRDPIGFDYLKQAKNALSIPYVAIGGVNRENIAEIMTFSPSLVGIIRDFQAAPDVMKRYFLKT